MLEAKELPVVRTPSGVELASEAGGDRVSDCPVAVVFLHATGFSRGVWRPIADQVGALVPTYSVDLRGHGGSSKPPPPYRWSYFADDVVAYVDQVPFDSVILCGHSVGGATAVEVAARLGERVASLALVEPALTPPHATTRGEEQPDPTTLLTTTQRRKHVWPTRAEAERHLASRSPYRYWDARVLRGFFATGLVDDPHLGCVLACPPHVEASIYSEASESKAWSHLRDLHCPVRIMRATGDQGMPSTASPLIVRHVHDGRETVVEGSGHFLPMERPDLVASFVRSMVEEATGGEPAPLPRR